MNDRIKPMRINQENQVAFLQCKFLIYVAKTNKNIVLGKRSLDIFEEIISFKKIIFKKISS